MTAMSVLASGIPFPKSEYDRRQTQVLQAVERAGLDALLVTAHTHLQYLTGYDGKGGYFRPFPLILVPGRAPTFVVREYDEQTVRAYSCIDEIVPYTHQADFAKVCGQVLRRYGLQNKAVGFELGCWGLAPADLSAIEAELPGIRVADATRIVPSISAVKSELELEAMRDSMTMTDLAIVTFQNSLKEGISETEVAAAIRDEVERSGGEGVMLNSLNFGERTKLPHGEPRRHAIRNDEPATVEVGGIRKGYVAGVFRSAVLGRNVGTESLHRLAEAVLEAAIAAIKPGVPAGEVNAAARKVIDRDGRPRVLRNRTGYQTGINWSDRGALSLEPEASDILKPGMTLHVLVILYSESGYMVGTSEQILVTDRGADIMSSTPHTLFRA
ncbi:Xaa-Pro peptidase family protein (plasmid) [Mesorhizobium sp. AR02]|uniref:M24 family metallopeptidase n=1 Tax=Mesorhizobium sp. AR02 TaxID=2865837 RepID=UPI00215F0EB6|nr:Xaa-Pro peptidase family protein [Mesorhizobium sp. AR02]UVK49970.1 Xaa-Pro peptidase family protein [Mesorhizobium sp. AR02]